MDISGGFVAATGARGPSLDDGWEEGGEAQIGFVLAVARWVGVVWCGGDTTMVTAQHASILNGLPNNH